MSIKLTDHESESASVLVGDCVTRMREIPDSAIRCCVTSPPYYGLRDYGVEGQIGVEKTPEEYVARLVEVFREVRRVLAPDGTLWLNLGDSYRDKQLLGIPWRTALALQTDGWILRSEIIWHKPNQTPESAADRPTRCHEHLFLLSCQHTYYYDADAIREPHDSAYSRDVIAKAGGKIGGTRPAGNNFSKESRRRDEIGTPRTRAERAALLNPLGRNKRDVWSINTRPFKGAHFAVFPPALVEPCVLAGSTRGDIVLDPFTGSGTTGLVALQHGRCFIGTELNPDYAALAWGRIHLAAPPVPTAEGIL